VISFDTNILVYAVDNTAGERHAIAADLIERSIRHGGCVQTLQSLAEFFSAVTRKASIAPDLAATFIKGWQATSKIWPLRCCLKAAGWPIFNILPSLIKAMVLQRSASSI